MIDTLRPGDLVRCVSCGAEVTASFSSGALNWRETYPVSLRWYADTPHERWHVTRLRPDRCPWCFERHEAGQPDGMPPWMLLAGDVHAGEVALIRKGPIGIVVKSGEPLYLSPAGDLVTLPARVAPGVVLEVGDLVAINGNGEARPAGPAKLRVVETISWPKRDDHPVRSARGPKKSPSGQGSLF